MELNDLSDKIRIGKTQMVGIYKSKHPGRFIDLFHGYKVEFSQETLIEFIRWHSSYEWKGSKAPIHDSI